MPVIDNDSPFNQYTFTQEELAVARFLNPTQQAYLQTKKALLLVQKASSMIPESGELDRSFYLRIGEIEGKINMINELFEDHKELIKEQSNIEQKDLQFGEGSKQLESLAARAAKAVNG